MIDADARDQIVAAVAAVAWSTLDHADPVQVRHAFDRVLDADSPAAAQQAYTAVLDAVAENHSGWLWEAAGPAAPLVAQIVERASGWPQWAAVEVLIELVSWARPDHPAMTSAIHRAVRPLHARLAALAASDTPVARSARQLIDHFCFATQVYTDNAAAMGATLATSAAESRDAFHADLPAVVRIIGRHPGIDVAALLARAPHTKTVTIEDPYGATSPTAGARMLRMPVMVRAAGDIQVVAAAPDVQVAPVNGPARLADAERVIVEGFPVQAHQPYVSGTALPPGVLEIPGWTVWLAHRGGQPAAAAYTYDDGWAIGVYWLATRPEHRSAGLARALLTRAIAAHPGRLSTLVATDSGLPLYKSLGFETVSTAHWHVRALAAGHG
jgi:ribosomal protein S18 acetylase RimI-like enzyme